MITEEEKELLSFFITEPEKAEWVNYKDWVCASSEDAQDLLARYTVIWLHEYPKRLYLKSREQTNKLLKVEG